MRTGIGAAEALRIVLESAPVLGAERLPAARALGRVLCESVSAARDLPPADNSAMDGYAVRRADLLGSGPERPVELSLAFEVAAGGDALAEHAPEGPGRRQALGRKHGGALEDDSQGLRGADSRSHLANVPQGREVPSRSTQPGSAASLPKD